MTLTSFLSPLGPTKSDFSVFLPGNGRRELAVKSRVTGRWTLLEGALDQVIEVRILEGQPDLATPLQVHVQGGASIFLGSSELVQGVDRRREVVGAAHWTGEIDQPIVHAVTGGAEHAREHAVVT